MTKIKTQQRQMLDFLMLVHKEFKNTGKMEKLVVLKIGYKSSSGWAIFTNQNNAAYLMAQTNCYAIGTIYADDTRDKLRNTLDNMLWDCMQKAINAITPSWLVAT